MINTSKFSLINRCSDKPELRTKQYKHVRDTITSQGYIAGAVALGTCVIYDKGSDPLKKFACDVFVTMTPFAAFAGLGRALTLTRKLGNLYKVGTMLYKAGMLLFKSIHFAMQSPFIALDMLMLGEPYIPSLNAKWWHIGNATDNPETAVEYFVNKNK